MDLTVTDADSPRTGFGPGRDHELLNGNDEEYLVDTTATAVIASYDSATGTLTLTGRRYSGRLSGRVTDACSMSIGPTIQIPRTVVSK